MAKAKEATQKGGVSGQTAGVIAGAALLGGGVLLAMQLGKKGGVKKPGDTVTCKITLKGNGNPGKFRVGFGLTMHPGAISLPEPIKQFVYKTVDLALDPNTSKTFTVTVSDMLSEIFHAGDMDALVFVADNTSVLDENPPPVTGWRDGSWNGYYRTKYYQKVFVVGE